MWPARTRTPVPSTSYLPPPPRGAGSSRGLLTKIVTNVGSMINGGNASMEKIVSFHMVEEKL